MQDEIVAMQLTCKEKDDFAFSFLLEILKSEHSKHKKTDM